MSTIPPLTPTTIAPHQPGWRQWTRYLYFSATSLVSIAIIIQVFFAGAAVLVDPAYWVVHRGFAHVIEYLVIALILVGIATRFPWRIQGLGGFLYILLFLQYLFLYLMPRMGMPILRAFHAVNALALFSVALMLSFQVWRHLRR